MRRQRERGPRRRRPRRAGRQRRPDPPRPAPRPAPPPGRPHARRPARRRRRRRPLPRHRRRRPPRPARATTACTPASASSTSCPSSPSSPATPRQRPHGRRRATATTSPAGSADELGVPSFLYGPLPGGRTRTLPDVRRHAFAPTEGLAPDFGPPQARPPRRRHRRRRPPGAGRLQRLGLLARGGPPGRPPGPRSPRAGARPGRGRPGPGLVQPDRARRLRAGRSSTTPWPPWPPKPAAPSRAPSWSACVPEVVLAAVPPRALARAGPQRARRRSSPAAGPALTARSASVAYEALRCPGGPGPGHGAGGGAPARSCRPRYRTSRRWPGRTRGSPPARHSPGRPPWPPGWTRPAPGKNRSGSTPMQFACSCQLRSWRP